MSYMSEMHYEVTCERGQTLAEQAHSARPSLNTFLTAAGLSVIPEKRVWAVQSDGRSIAWCGTEDEALALAWELAAELIAEGLTGEIDVETEWA